MQILRKIAIWTVFILLGLFYILMGIMKIAVPVWAIRFTDWGYPAFLAYVVGVVELLAGIALLVPRWRGYAGAALAVVMLGAWGTHIIHAEFPNIIVTGVLTLIFSAVVFFHRGTLFPNRDAG